MKKRSPGGITFLAVSYGGAAEILNFEQTNVFWVYAIQNGKVKKRQLLSLYAESKEELIRKVADSQLDAVICRNFGPRAMAELKQAGLLLYTYTGGCAAAAKAFVAGELREL